MADHFTDLAVLLQRINAMEEDYERLRDAAIGVIAGLRGKTAKEVCPSLAEEIERLASAIVNTEIK